MKRIVLVKKDQEFRHKQYVFHDVAFHTETLEEVNVYFHKKNIDSTPVSIKEGKYRHFKGGEYQYVGIGYYGEDLVIYKSLYDSEKYPEGTLWARPLADFIGTREVDGIEVPRFEYIGK